MAVRKHLHVGCSLFAADCDAGGLKTIMYHAIFKEICAPAFSEGGSWKIDQPRDQTS
jgi:hypothetical protein